MKHLKLILKTLINNNACVEAARTNEKKYNIIAVAFFFLAIFFAVLPTCVTGFQQQGSAWINGTTYNIDNGLQEFGNYAKTNSLKITLNKNKTITITGMDTTPFEAKANDLKEESDGTIIVDPTQRPITGVHRYMYSDFLFSGSQLTDVLEVYAFDESGESLQKKVTNIINNYVPTCPDTESARKKEENWLKLITHKNNKKSKLERSTSVIIFGKDCYYGILYNPNGGSVASTYGDYHHMEYNNIIDELTDDNNNIFKTLDNWRLFSDLGVIDTRFVSTWRSTGIMIGVDAGVTLFLGFIVWILTRGKNNPFRIYTIWDTMKIAFYASLAPGILALLGFLMANLAMMLFVIGVGVRVMWLSMRTLRYQAPAAK